MMILGVCVSSGVIYYGALHAATQEQPPRIPSQAPEKVEPASGLMGADRLGDIYGRISQDLRVLVPQSVVIVGTRKHANWKYRDATERITLLSALMLACSHEQVACQEWKTETISKLTQTPAASLADFDYTELGLAQRPRYWRQGRGAAFAAATSLVRSSHTSS
ncbi:hypothetical protein HNR25_003904 [Streptomonospora salina]|uniref:Uncharacterized protein n=1 Tax=Streptomonospora salina TaxID=104205 RepID=A0A841EGK2_9ACTN|nr:hypothetical protein [Streptomonospora salina]